MRHESFPVGVRGCIRSGLVWSKRNDAELLGARYDNGTGWISSWYETITKAGNGISSAPS